MRFTVITDIFFFALLLLCADSDRRIHQIPNQFLWGIGLLGLARFGYVIGRGASVWPCLCAAPLFLILMLLWNEGQIGGGDVKLMSLMCFYTGIYTAVLGFAFTAVLLALWCLVRTIKGKRIPKKQVALAPSLAFGCIGAMIAQYIFLYA